MPIALRVAVLGERGDRLREAEREDHDQQAHQHRAGDIQQRLAVPVDPETPDQPMQQPRQEQRLERQREQRRRHTVVLAGAPGEQQRRQAQQQRPAARAD